jgi:hypothetical protein
MKAKVIVTLCVLALLLGHVNTASAYDGEEGAGIVADVVVARPFCLAATVVGSAFFLLALPFALASNTVDRTANVLVVKPAKATFTRPLGDFEAIKE